MPELHFRKSSSLFACVIEACARLLARPLEKKS